MAEQQLLELERGTILLITEEIKHKGSGYLLIKGCSAPENIPHLLEKGIAQLQKAGANQIFAASSLSEAPLTGECYTAGKYKLVFEGNMLEMCRPLPCPVPRGIRNLILAPVSKENGLRFIKLYNETFYAVPNSATYDEKELPRLLDTTKTLCYLVSCQDEEIGIAELDLQQEIPEISGVAIRQHQRGKGIGSSLLYQLMEVLAQRGASQVSLRVHEANPGALGLYQRLGFAVTKVLTRWYRLQS